MSWRRPGVNGRRGPNPEHQPRRSDLEHISSPVLPSPPRGEIGQRKEEFGADSMFSPSPASLQRTISIGDAVSDTD